jgi:peptidylprolyl isomerase
MQSLLLNIALTIRFGLGERRAKPYRYNDQMRISRSLALFVLASALAFAQNPASQLQAPSDVAAPPADATKTAGGLATKVITPGTGKVRPAKDEVVTIDYTGWTTDGKVVDSSVARHQPATIQIKKLFPGLGEGVQLMVVGETRRLWIPESLTYKGQEGKPKGMLVFDVTLVDLPTRAPADLERPSPDAKKTKSGLFYEVLKPGTGQRHPTRADRVVVNYTGWNTDGKMFDSSLVRGQPASFPLDRVIPGWTEGVQLMVEGEKMRFWIPERLAYQGTQPPYGALVFDIELIKIQ